jgi:apolipoprotein D and lipocalin family protein
MNRMPRRWLVVSSVVLAGCAGAQRPAMVSHVDLQRFMGDWYVIGNIPTFVEKNRRVV